MSDVWPASESARFHRGIASAVTVLAAAWPLATAFTVEGWVTQLLLLMVAFVIVLAALPLWSHLRRTPAVAEGVRFRALEADLLYCSAVAEPVACRRTSYASDRRESDQDV